MGKLNVGDAVRSRLELLLKLNEISKAELARRCGLPSRTVENYFKGHAPSAEALFLIARGTGFSVDWLLGDLAHHMGEPPERPNDFDPVHASIKLAAAELLGDYAPRMSHEPPSAFSDELAEKIAVNARQKLAYLGRAGLLVDDGSSFNQE